jgi:hypothetical protein
MGDETKGRIADLASGWDVDSDDPKPPDKKLEPKPLTRVEARTPPRGDDTNARIAELASGWSVDGADTPEDSPALLAPAKAMTDRGSAATRTPPSAPEPRRKAKTLPPPPPGSQERKALEAAIMESTTGPVPKSEPVRSPTSSPPPLPPVGRKTGGVPALPAAAAKSGANAKPPNASKYGPTETGTVDISGTIATHGLTPAPVILRPDQVPGVNKPALPPAMPLPPPPPTNPSASQKVELSKSTVELVKRPNIANVPPDESGNAGLTVPIGEFSTGTTNIEHDKRRIAYEQSTIKRDTASALLEIPEQPLTVVKDPPVEILLGESAAQIVRGDATSIDPKTMPFERGDPTLGPDATSIDPPNAALHATGGKLRTQASLRRKRGIGGDVRYVATAIFGVRRARRELGDLELQQATRLKSRARHLLTLGRSSVSSEGYDHPALNKARESLGVIEDERATHAAAVSAADSELMRVRSDRAEKAKAHAEGIANAEAELAEIAKKLDPLEKEAASAARKAADLHEQLRRIDAQIAATEASKTSVKNKADPAQIQAEMASLKADRVAVTRDEPRIAAELDALNPRIAALEARRIEARKRKAELEEEEQKDRGRSEELLAAIGAKRKVVDRAAADAEAMRDKILLELGERIYVDRPPKMTFELAPIDAIDVELGTTDRRMMELKEIISSVDKAKLARGIAVIILALALVGAIAYALIFLLA